MEYLSQLLFVEPWHLMYGNWSQHVNIRKVSIVPRPAEAWIHPSLVPKL